MKRRAYLPLAAVAVIGFGACIASGQPAWTAAPDPASAAPQAVPQAAGPQAEQPPPPPAGPQPVQVALPPGAVPPQMPPGVAVAPSPQQAAPAPPSTRPAVALPTEFAVLMTRNVFARGSGGGGPPPVPAAGGPEANFGLKGILNEDGQFTAFVEDLAAKKTVQLRAGDAVAAGRVKSIAFDGVEYESVLAHQTKRVKVGQNLLGAPLPPPQPPTTAPAKGPAGPPGPGGPPGQAGPMPPGAPGAPPHGVIVTPGGVMRVAPG